MISRDLLLIVRPEGEAARVLQRVLRQLREQERQP